MNEKKRIEILRKRNTDLSLKVDEMKRKMHELENMDSGDEKLSSLMEEINDLKKEFTDAISDLVKARERYDTLFKQMMAIKKNFQIMRIPWYRKLFNKIVNKIAK